MTPATITPSSPSTVYLARRDAGKTHDEAEAAAEHAYGRRPGEYRHLLARVRDEYEAQPAEVVEPPQESVEQHPLDPVEGEIRARIEQLQRDRAGLALDAMSDDKAKARLGDVSDRLANAEVELENVGLARAEGIRRESEAKRQAEEEARQEALARVADLQGDRQRAEGKMATAATAYARAVAALYAVVASETRARVAAGEADAWRSTAPRQSALRQALTNELLAAGAPPNLLD
jgi:hypothetical protein